LSPLSIGSLMAQYAARSTETSSVGRAKLALFVERRYHLASARLMRTQVHLLTFALAY
jgi:hypothetical protein